MKNYFKLLTLVIFFSCNEGKSDSNTNEQVPKNQSISEPKKWTFQSNVHTTWKINNIGPLDINYEFYGGKDSTMGLIHVKKMVNDLFSDPIVYGWVKDIYKTRPLQINNIRLEQHLIQVDKTITPVLKDDKEKTENLMNKALAFAIKFWKNCGLEFKENNIVFINKLPIDKNIDTTKAFVVYLNGPMFFKIKNDLQFYIGNEFLFNKTGTFRLENLGETNTDMAINRDTTTGIWSFPRFNKSKINIDISGTDVQFFESVFFELLHQIVLKICYSKMLEHLNSPPYYNRYELIFENYTRLDEVAVHYSVICLFKEMIKKGLFPSKYIIDPFSQYRDNLSYKGLLPLISKYPTTLENGEKILKTFLKDPLEIDKLLK